MNNIKLMRLKRGLTQEQLGKKLGVPQSTIACWETGRAMPRANVLPMLAKVLKCKIEKLYS